MTDIYRGYDNIGHSVVVPFFLRVTRVIQSETIIIIARDVSPFHYNLIQISTISTFRNCDCSIGLAVNFIEAEKNFCEV